MYESLANNEDRKDPLFTRLERGINSVFGRTMQEYFEQNEVEEKM